MRSEDKDPAVDRWLDGLAPSQPPAELRSKVLAVARDRMASAEASDSWSAAWRSRGLRLAWAAAVAMLLAGHVVISFGGTSTPGSQPTARVGDPYLAAMLRPIRISNDVRPMVGVASSAERDEYDQEGNPS
jgi:hypothetical protein